MNKKQLAAIGERMQPGLTFRGVTVMLHSKPHSPFFCEIAVTYQESESEGLSRKRVTVGLGESFKAAVDRLIAENPEVFTQ